MFLEFGRQYFNTDYIVAIKKLSNGIVIVFANGDREIIEDEDIYTISTKLTRIVTAPPGWKIALKLENGDTGLLEPLYQSVIAFTVDTGGNITPITASGENQDEDYVIINPDGGVEDPYTASYESIKEWLEADTKYRLEKKRLETEIECEPS